MKFRKKPAVIEAIQWDGKIGTFWNIAELSTDREVSSIDGGLLSIKTLEGTMVANIGDWVIKGVKGEIYPCRDDIFEMTYEPVEE